MAEIDLTGLLGIETPETRSARLLSEGTRLAEAVRVGSPAAVAAANLPVAQDVMRGSVGRLFGIDTRPATEKLAEQLASKPLTTAADYTNAAQVAKNLGLSAQAIQLNALATEKQKEEEQTRIKTEATISQRSALAQRVQAEIQNTSDPRVQRALLSLIPSIGSGVLSESSELNTAIDEAFSRSEIKPMTAAQRTSYDNLITEDPELMKLIEEPSFLSKVFGSGTTPEMGREALISELHILQQQNPNIPIGQLADVFLESVGPQILQVEGVGDLSDLPSEEAPQIEPYDPSMEPIPTEEQPSFLSEDRRRRREEITELQKEVNAELDRLGYADASPRVRNQQYQRLMSSKMRAKGMYKSPPPAPFQPF